MAHKSKQKSRFVGFFIAYFFICAIVLVIFALSALKYTQISGESLISIIDTRNFVNKPVIENHDELTRIVNEAIAEEFYSPLQLDENNLNLQAIWSENESAQLIEQSKQKLTQLITVDYANQFYIPSQNYLESQIKNWFEENKLELNEENESKITQFAVKINLRFISLFSQLMESRHFAIDFMRELFIILFYVFIVFYIFGLILLFILRCNSPKRVIWLNSIMIFVALLLFSFYLTSFNITQTSTLPDFLKIQNIEISNKIDPQIDKPTNFEASSYLPKIVYRNDLQDFKEGNIFGHINIETQGISQDLIDGTSDENLKKTTAREHVSAIPGELGYVVLAGHNWGYANGSFTRNFGKIHYLSEGDIFTIDTNYGNFIYKVTSSYVAKAHNYPLLEKINDKSERKILLYSCWPIDSSSTPDRSFVEAKQIAGPIVK